MSDEDIQLELEDDPRSDREPGTALERIRAVSVALSDAARRTRLSSRRRDFDSGGGFKARRGAKLFRLLMIGSFLLIVAAPTLATAVYYYGFASDQYVSETDFTVAVGEAPVPDNVAAITGIPALAIIQDTQIVVNYIHSRAAVEKLDHAVGLRTLYSRPEADWLARFDNRKPIERFLSYWNTMATAGIVMPAGIVQLRVRAFTPEDARKIAQASLDVCEQMVNDLNTRADRDAVAGAEEELKRSSQRVASALAALEAARNESGILETSHSEASLESLIKDAKSRLLSLQGGYDASLKYVGPDAPQMKELSTRIEITRRQIVEIEAKLTASSEAPNTGETTVANAMSKFGELDLERTVAEKLYSTAAAALEAVRVNAENRQMYFKTFVFPADPQEALYPKRAMKTLTTLGLSLLAWFTLGGVAALIRNNMA
jgi:capsular polysaccharide transport system permease protein